MRVVVTRPAAQAAEWVAELRAQGIDAAALPLIGIAPARDEAAVRAAWATLATRRLVVFVSPNAAEQFFACAPTAATWPGDVLAGSPGPGTTQVLRRLGVPATALVEPAAEALQFDSEALWAPLSVVDWRGRSVLIVRGDGGREWLADTLKAQGAGVEYVAAYRRTPPVFGDAERALLGAALDRPGDHLWFFSSSEAIDNLAEMLPQLSPSGPAADSNAEVLQLAAAASAFASAHALATHPRIGARARRLGFASVAQARPSLAAVVACLQSMRP